ncbi:regulation of enolase protein 1 (concanavalin A-like superfamily) [Allocatelliglobosispora scoriae]|uniref:Regulation of enolase protein 1 (Concanavalin A-like superfamily) n=1 Tax=Allocatelliglobosispora scoriae TaxID=643052 RepID=A0A841BFV0_9ACTN|nr:DUF1349 domain-containing protein [Allocatelliglobosispora scoriae]MBB5867164.1 regulation of enolase protein 1 (concanavalin A-like superfamily) [Allocatelliglobosispora scoriae]
MSRMDDAVEIAGIPAPMHWSEPPVATRYADGVLRIEAGGLTDLFADPAGLNATVNAPRLLAEVTGDFQLSAKVTVGFKATYDAGVLLLWAGERQWAKVCFERSPQGQPMVVSVVTRGTSDDANAFTVDGDTVWLRVSRIGPAYAFHASTDGQHWEFVRYFGLGTDAAEVGFEVQSPTGKGCTARFAEITFTATRLAELRDGN